MNCKEKEFKIQEKNQKKLNKLDNYKIKNYNNCKLINILSNRIKTRDIN